MKVERAQHGEDLRPSDGEAGFGVYAYVPSAAMRAYYSAAGENVFELELDAARVVDLTEPARLQQLVAYARATFARRQAEMPGYRAPAVTSSTIQRFGSVIEQFVREHHAGARSWVVPHQGPGIPTGKQVVIADETVVLECRPREAAATTAPARRPRPR